MELMFLDIWQRIRQFLSHFTSSDLEVMSEEMRSVLANPEDAKKYNDAIDKLEKGETEVTIELSNKKSITLVQ